MSEIKHSLNNFFGKKYIAFFLILLIGVGISVVAYFNEICEGGPDGQWHYYFSRYSYQFPKFFLHHWGKPIFIFLSAPFAQFGFYALEIFNILCGLLSAYVVYKWCKKLNFGYSLISIILLLFMPLYFIVIQSALTEPLFSLLLVLSAYLLFTEKYFLGVVVASFLMYSRTEGLFLIPIFAVYIIIVRQYKYLPFFATAFIIYSFVGLFSGHDFLWFFTENPYNAISPYGHGTWSHFFEKYNVIFGKPFLIFFAIGFIIMVRNIIVKKEFLFFKIQGANFKVFYLAFIPAAVFFAFHVYAWGAGKFASAGLERVMACILPLCVIISMYFFDLIHKIRFDKVRAIALIIIVITTVNATFDYYHYPLKAYGPEKASRDAAVWFKNYRATNSILYYAHPALIFHCNFNPFDESNKECFVFPGNCAAENKVKFYYFWDSQFSESSCGKSLKSLEECENLKKIKEFEDYGFKYVVFETK